MDFSVLIRTHNRHNHLEIALKSVLEQKTLPKEIFVLDDLNQNEVKKIIYNLKKNKLVEIFYVNTQNQYNSLRNLNIISEQSNSEFIAFLDDDDTWDNSYLDDNLNLLISENIDIIYTNFNMVFENNKKKFEIKKRNFNENIISNNGFLISNLIVRKNVFEKLNGFDYKLNSSADKDFYLNALLKKKYKVKIQEKFLVNYRIFKKKKELKWSDDIPMILNSKLLFYKKYFFKINFFLHLKMVKEILRIFLQIFIKVK